MLSLAQVSTPPELNISNFNAFAAADFSYFNAFATAVGCTQVPGTSRLQCLRNVSASTIRAYTNGPQSGSFTPGVDKYVF